MTRTSSKTTVTVGSTSPVWTAMTIMLMVLLALALTVAIPKASAQTQHGIQFAWTESDPTAVSFNLYCGTTAGGEPSTPTQTGIAASPYLWTGGTPGTKYWCKLTALNAVGQESGMSNETSQTFPAPPSSPTNLTSSQK